MQNSFEHLPPRICPPNEIPAEAVESLNKTLLAPGQRPLNIFCALAVHPALLKRLNIYTGLFMTKGLLSARTRELLVLRVAHRIDCAYEWQQHVALASAAGVSDAEIVAVGKSPLAYPWTAEDAACLSLCDDLLATADISDDAWTAIKAGPWTDAQIEEMILLVGCYRMIGGLLKGIRVPLDDFTVSMTESATDAAQ